MPGSRVSTPRGLASNRVKVPLVDLYRPRTAARRCLESEVPRRSCTSATPKEVRHEQKMPAAVGAPGRNWVYSPTTWYRPVPPSTPQSQTMTTGEVEALTIEDCMDFVVHLGLPPELGLRLFAELDAEGGLTATEAEANSPQDMEWLVSHFGPKIETRFLLFWPQMVPALRRCVDFGFGWSGAKRPTPRPSLDSTRMAMALGAVGETTEVTEPTEAAASFRKPFLSRELDLYQTQVETFQAALKASKPRHSFGRGCNGPSAHPLRQRQHSARLSAAASSKLSRQPGQGWSTRWLAGSKKLAGYLEPGV